MCVLKGSQINVQHSLIQKLQLNEFELGHNTAETTKNIYCVKSKGAVNHSNQMVQELSLRLKKKQNPTTIRQGQLGIKPWIPKLFPKL